MKSQQGIDNRAAMISALKRAEAQAENAAGYAGMVRAEGGGAPQDEIDAALSAVSAALKRAEDAPAGAGGAS